MTITATFTDPFFTGGGLSALVPAVYPVAINGRPYMIDEKPETYLAAWQHETIPLLRAQSDDSSSPAERSLNPQGLWRRAQDSWHHGAGQVYRDRDEAADPYRFRSSKGVDPWTRYQFSPLPDTAISKSGAGTNQFVVTTGTRAYFADTDDLYWSTDLVSWTAVTGYTGGTITSITSDGFNVYFTDGVDIWTTNQGTGAATDADNTNATLLRYVKGRLMVAVGSELQNIPVLNAAATMTYTHLNTAFTWVDCCEGNGHIYAAGFSGDKSVIYRTAVKADGTALDLPIAAGALPDGEIVRAIQGYLGFIWIGSDLGVRFAEVNTQGDLTIGPLIETPAAVKAFEAQARFMWFGWTAYDAVSTGLGRMDLTEFVGIDQPAYASDLMVTGQGAVTSIATFLEKRIFTVNGAGIYQQDTDLVASGTIDCGQVSFGLPDLKTAVFLDVATEPLVGCLHRGAVGGWWGVHPGGGGDDGGGYVGHVPDEPGDRRTVRGTAVVHLGVGGTDDYPLDPQSDAVRERRSGGDLLHPSDPRGPVAHQRQRLPVQRAVRARRDLCVASDPRDRHPPTARRFLHRDLE